MWAPWLLDQMSPRCQSGVVLGPVVSMRWRWCTVFAQNLENVAADEQSVGKTSCPVVAAQTSAKTLRNSVDDASTLKPCCKRGSRVCKEPSGGEARAQRSWAENFSAQHLFKGCQG